MTQEESGRNANYEKVGILMWVVGSGAFIISSLNSGDNWALIGSVLFFVGIIAFAKPLFKP